MSKPLITATLLTTVGAAIGFTYHALNRGTSTMTNPRTGDTTEVPAWEKTLHRAASLPWGYLHPAGRFVTTENLGRVLATARHLRTQHAQHTATQADPATVNPQVVKEEEAPTPTASPADTATPLASPISIPIPASREEAITQISTLLVQARDTATATAKRYQDDPEFRANVQQAAQAGATALASLRKQASRRTGGTPRA